ncbi:hypothetical protein Tco_0479547, partial [Tanacetum coccineum]
MSSDSNVEYLCANLNIKGIYDNEGPSAGSNQGRSTKRRRPESAASGSAQPPLK